MRVSEIRKQLSTIKFPNEMKRLLYSYLFRYKIKTENNIITMGNIMSRHYGWYWLF